MAKKQTFINHTADELTKFVEEKREELRALRFGASGSKNANVKAPRNLRKEIARVLTQMNAAKTAK